MIKKRLAVSIIFSFLFLFIGVYSLPNYGVNWDESVHFGRGQAILHFFLTGEKDYESFEKNHPARRSFYQSDNYKYSYFEKTFRTDSNLIIGAGHPVLSDFLASITNRIFYGWLGILGDIESYHLYSIIFSAFLVGVVVYFTSSIYGTFAGVIAGLSLFLYPLFFGESRFNIKDLPETAFYTISAITFYKGVVANKWKWILVSSIFAGFAFGTKLNIVFLSIPIVIWLSFYWGSIIKKLSFQKFIKAHKKILIMFVLFPIAPFIIYFLSWPMLWEDPFGRFLYNMSYYKSVGISSSLDPRFSFFGINMYAPAWILFTTPIIVLVLGLVGFFWSIKFGFREKNKTSLFVLLLFLVPIARVMFPGAGIYGGVRQIMEYIPAMAILAGIGANYIAVLLNIYIVRNLKQFNNIAIKQFPKLIIILLFIPIIFKIISLYPNESVYFNPLIGGLKGAVEKNIPGWGNSLGSTYRQGAVWLNKNAEPNAKLATIYELRSNISLKDLRQDILYANSYRSSILRKGEYVMGVTHEGTNAEGFHRKYLERFLVPVHEVIIDGVSVLKIWKNDFEHTKPAYKKLENKITDFDIIKGENYLRVDLKKTIPVTRVYINYDQNNCVFPTEGYFELSFNGNIWRREGYFAVGTRTQLSEIGAFRYLFAAERTRFVRAVISDKESCLLKNPVEIEVYGM